MGGVFCPSVGRIDRVTDSVFSPDPIQFWAERLRPSEKVAFLQNIMRNGGQVDPLELLQMGANSKGFQVRFRNWQVVLVLGGRLIASHARFFFFRTCRCC